MSTSLAVDFLGVELNHARFVFFFAIVTLSHNLKTLLENVKSFSILFQFVEITFKII